MDSIVSKVDVGRHVADDSQNSHPDVDTEVRNQGLDPALRKKSRAKPKKIVGRKASYIKRQINPLLHRYPLPVLKESPGVLWNPSKKHPLTKP